MKKSISVKKIIENYFKNNPSKNINDMTLDEFYPMYKEIGMYCADQVITELGKITIGDICHMQNVVSIVKDNIAKQKQTKTVSNKQEKKHNVSSSTEIKKTSRKNKKDTGCENCGLFSKRKDVPASVNSNCVYMVYTRKDGKRLNPLYAVLDSGLPINRAKARIKQAYAKFQNTNYLNVSLKLADYNYDKMRRKPAVDAKFFGEYYVPVAKR